MCDKALFLFRQEKGQKKPTQGCCKAQRIYNGYACRWQAYHNLGFEQMRPLAYPPPHRRNMYQNLAKNNPKHSKIFPKCATGGVHRGGCMPARERAPKRLPCAAFFGYFLVRAQESNTSPFAISTINCNFKSASLR